MNKISLAILIAASLASSVALAGHSTVSVGYAQSKVQGFDNINGVNAKYRYEFDSSLGLVGSVTYMKGNGDDYVTTAKKYVHENLDIKYYSVMAGPTYSFNDYVSLYAMWGAAHVKANGTNTQQTARGVSHSSISGKSTSFAWGAGVITNPTDSFSISAGYECTEASIHGNHNVNGFNVGFGYRF